MATASTISWCLYQLKMREVAKVPIASDAYSLYVKQRDNALAQVFSLDYGNKLRIYDVSGDLRSSRGWSSKVRCIAVGDIDGEGNDALVGGVGKKLIVIDHHGTPMWKINLESTIIACDARDIDGDDAAEVVVALQNKRVVLWNNDQVALFSRKFDNPITDVWLEDITNDTELEVVVADKRGNVIILTAAGYELRHLELGESITVFGVLIFGERRLFVTGNHSNTLKVWDIDGRQVTSIELTGKPKALATGIPDDVSDLSYMVVSTHDRKLSFWEIRESGRATKEERITLQEIESTKTILYRRAIKCGNCGAPTSPEAHRCDACGAVLEMLDEYVIEEFIKESIDSITSKHTKIKLKDLDRILRRTLPQPAAYNLRRVLQSMIKKKTIEGHIDDNTFVRTKKSRIGRAKRPSRQEIKKVPDVLMALLKKEKRFEIDELENRTGIDRVILRRTLLILLGDGVVEGELSGDEFFLNKRQNTQEFIRKLESELSTSSR